MNSDTASVIAVFVSLLTVAVQMTWKNTQDREREARAKEAESEKAWRAKVDSRLDSAERRQHETDTQTAVIETKLETMQGTLAEILADVRLLLTRDGRDSQPAHNPGPAPRR